MCARRELAHLSRGWRIVVDKIDLVDPLDADATVSARDDEPDGKTVIARQGRTVHSGRQKSAGLVELVARKHPACTRDRRGGPFGIVNTAHEHWARP